MADLMMWKFNPKSNDMLELVIAPDDQQQGWEIAQKLSRHSHRYMAYLNYVAYRTFIPWLADWLGAEFLGNPTVWPEEKLLPIIWEFVAGTAIQVGDKRLVLIVSDEEELESLEVPQEWVDNPQWRGDYYLAVTVSLDGDEDDCWMRVWGFTTHRILKQGIYNDQSRSYSLAREDLTGDLMVMQVTWGLEVRANLASLLSLSEAEAQGLLRVLGKPELHSPRLNLAVPFGQWAALLNDDNWREQLWQRCQEKLVNPGLQKPLVNLRGWLDNMVAEGQQMLSEGWQRFEEVLAPPEPVTVRGNGEVMEAIGPMVRLLKSNHKQELRYHAAGVLGEIGAGNPEAITALTWLLQAAEDEHTRWQAALSLGKIDPGNPAAGVKKAKLVDLGMQLQGQAIALVVAIMPQSEGRLGVFVQVQPKHQPKLPPNLKLTILSEADEPIPGLTVTSRSDDLGLGKDNLIQMNFFSPPPGTRFRVRVTLNDASITEDFVA
ncbi:DUF1822 family protein [[Phormidium] sp. ETS-05]|uniref:DUF1822 family protein n=1 Tax=[Phormidium] sp. ETS-05 TaxID=222819 RepID=UPI0018EEE310|nr:DUF1822 family protein [[Phormidium] sp. ETS-05]